MKKSTKSPNLRVGSNARRRDDGRSLSCSGESSLGDQNSHDPCPTVNGALEVMVRQIVPENVDGGALLDVTVGLMCC
jgi:hypothetical protein